VVPPTNACQVIDWRSRRMRWWRFRRLPLAQSYCAARTLRFADGPDEVHRNAIAKWELGKYGAYGRDAQVPVTRDR